MKNQIKFLIVILLFASSCNEIERKQKSNNSIDSNEIISSEIQVSDILVTKPINETQIEIIEEDCICLTQLTTEECDSLEKLDPESYSIHSDHLNNESTRINELMEDNNIKSVWTNKRYICFKTKDKEFCIDTRKKDLAMQCLIFDKKNGLKIVDSESIDETNINKLIRKN